MNYTNEIRKKAMAFSNQIERNEVTILLNATAKHISPDNQDILYKFLSDFDAEFRVSEKFKNWLRQKSITQTELFR